MGHLSGHPDTDALIDETNRRIVAAGRTAGAVVGDDTLDKFLDQGALFLMSSWQKWVEDGARAYLNRVGAATD